MFKHIFKFRYTKTTTSSSDYYKKSTTEKTGSNSILNWALGCTFAFPLNQHFVLNISSGMRIFGSRNTSIFGGSGSTIPNGDSHYVDKWDICIAKVGIEYTFWNKPRKKNTQTN